MARPVIGATAYQERARWGAWETPAALLPAAYVTAIHEAGGRPLLVPPVDHGAAETVAVLDGLVVAGGADIDPSSYGAPRHPQTAGLRPERDRAETALLEAALEADLPVLAICRGMQLLNVVRGGDLVQHLEGDLHRPRPGEFSTHPVRVAADSRLAAIVGTSPVVASHHHQAPDRLGSGLRAVAWASDGVTEAVEDPDRRFLLGVLWHPEEGDDRSLFTALVGAAGVD